MHQSADILDRVTRLADELKLASLRPQIVACRNQLHAHNNIDVVVFGRFKAGKSSFLNHLTGRDVLPIGVVPLTAVITRLRYASNEEVEVRFLNGSAKTVPLDEIGRYVDENKNPNNEKQVASVEVELPALKPFAPLQFVDTPGLGSAFTHNTEAALNWLPNVGMALVAVSSDAPLSERDLALLDELRRHTPKIVLLLTKADLLNETQRAEVLAFVREQCRRKWTMELPVFFYSIQPALAKFKTELNEELLTPLRRNRGEAAGQILRHKLQSLTLQTLDYARVALAAATQAESARAALREKLDEERRQFDLLRSELNVLSHQWSANALNWSLARLQPTQAALQLKIMDDLRGQLPRWQLRLPALLKVWREWLDIILQRELSIVSREQQTMFREPLHRARQHLTRTLRAFHDRLAEHVKAALGVSLTPREFILEAPEPAVPPVDVAFVDAAFSLVSFAIPMTLFRRPIERALLRKSRWEVEKNLSRLASDWRDRVAAGINELTRQAEQEAFDELAALEQMLMQTQSNAPRLRQIIADLENGAPAATIQGVNELHDRVTTLLKSGGNREAVLEQTLRAVLEHFHSETGTIHWLDDDKQSLHLVAQLGLPPQMLEIVKTIPVGKGIAGQVIARGGPVTICNLQTDTGNVAKPGAKRTGVGGALCVPICYGDKIVGTIGIGTMRQYEYTPAETRLLEEIGRLIGTPFGGVQPAT